MKEDEGYEFEVPDNSSGLELFTEEDLENPADWADLVSRNDKRKFNLLDLAGARCRNLRVLDAYFVYCLGAAKSHSRGGAKFTAKPSEKSAQYRAKIDPDSTEGICLSPDKCRECQNYKL